MASNAVHGELVVVVHEHDVRPTRVFQQRLPGAVAEVAVVAAQHEDLVAGLQRLLGDAGQSFA